MVGRVIDGASGASVAVAQAAAADLAGTRRSGSPVRAARRGVRGRVRRRPGPGFAGCPRRTSAPFFLAAGIAAVNTAVAARRLPETHPSRRPTVPRPGFGPVRALAPMLVVAFCALVAFSGFEATFALFGQRHLGFGIASSAAVFTAVGAAIVVVQGGLVHRVVGRPSVRCGPCWPGCSPTPPGWRCWPATRSWALAVPRPGGAHRRAGPGADDDGDDRGRPGRPGPTGRVLGAQQSASGLARVAGPALGGALLGSRASGDPYVLGCALSLAAAGLAGGRRQRPPSDIGHSDVRPLA